MNDQLYLDYLGEVPQCKLHFCNEIVMCFKPLCETGTHRLVILAYELFEIEMLNDHIKDCYNIYIAVLGPH